MARMLVNLGKDFVEAVESWIDDSGKLALVQRVAQIARPGLDAPRDMPKATRCDRDPQGGAHVDARGLNGSRVARRRRWPRRPIGPRRAASVR